MAVRAALGAKKINYFGYSYGTYLGAVYGKLFPHRVRRAVLDSVVDPSGVWYDDNLQQDQAFNDRNSFFSEFFVTTGDATKIALLVLAIGIVIGVIGATIGLRRFLRT